MKTKFMKQQKVSITSKGRSITFNDECYSLKLEISDGYETNKITATAVNNASKESYGGILSRADFVKLIGAFKAGCRIQEYVNLWLPMFQDTIKLTERDFVVLDLVLNEPDDSIMFELIEKLGAA